MPLWGSILNLCQIASGTYTCFCTILLKTNTSQLFLSLIFCVCV